MCLKPSPTGPALGRGHVSRRRHLRCSTPPPGATLCTPELHTHYSFRSTGSFWTDNLQQLMFLKNQFMSRRKLPISSRRKGQPPNPKSSWTLGAEPSLFKGD